MISFTGYWDEITHEIEWWDVAEFCWDSDGHQTSGPIGFFKRASGIARAESRPVDNDKRRIESDSVSLAILAGGPIASGRPTEVIAGGAPLTVILRVDTTKVKRKDVVTGAAVALSVFDHFDPATPSTKVLQLRAIPKHRGQSSAVETSARGQAVLDAYDRARQAGERTISGVGAGRLLVVNFPKGR